MVTHDDGANKNCEGLSEKGEKRCFDLFATLLSAYGNDETRAKRGKEEQERNMLMIQTITSVATDIFLLGKRKIDYDHESKNQENTSSSDSSSLVESKRRRVVVSNDEPIRAQPIRQIKPRVKERKAPVKRKEPVRREPVVTPGWVIELMKTFNGEGDAKMIFEKVLTKTDLTPNHGRLLMPFNQMSEKDFLTEAEVKILEEHNKHKGDAKKKGVLEDKKPKGVDVILLNRNGDREWNLNMRIWEMRSTFNYALCTRWNQVVRENDLKTNQTITLWSFHSHDGTLYFASDLPTPAEDEGIALALVPVTHAASSSSSMDTVVISEEDPFECEEINRSLYQFFPTRSRTPPPEECTEMDLDLEDVQEMHIRSSTSQESLTETSLVSWWFELEEAETAVLYVTLKSLYYSKPSSSLYWPRTSRK